MDGLWLCGGFCRRLDAGGEMFADGLTGISRWRRMLCARTCPLDGRAAAGDASRLARACRVGIARSRVCLRPARACPAFCGRGSCCRLFRRQRGIPLRRLWRRPHVLLVRNIASCLVGHRNWRTYAVCPRGEPHSRTYICSCRGSSPRILFPPRRATHGVLAQSFVFGDRVPWRGGCALVCHRNAHLPQWLQSPYPDAERTRSHRGAACRMAVEPLPVRGGDVLLRACRSVRRLPCRAFPMGLGAQRRRAFMDCARAGGR